MNERITKWKQMLRSFLIAPKEILREKLLDSMFINCDIHHLPPILANGREYQTNNFNWAINAVISYSSKDRIEKQIVLYINTHLSYKDYHTYTAEYVIANNAKLLGLDIRYTSDKNKKKYIVKYRKSWENSNQLIKSQS